MAKPKRQPDDPTPDPEKPASARPGKKKARDDGAADAKMPEATPPAKPRKKASPRKKKPEVPADPAPAPVRGKSERTPPTKPKSAKGRSPKGKSNSLDWWTVADAMWKVLGREAPPDENDPDSPRSRASETLHRAYLADEPELSYRLAQEALAIWPDSAEALVLLAELAKGPKEALTHYTRAMDAAIRDLGPRALELGAGQFWKIPQTRPYMRACFGLARVLWVIGRRAEAVEHFKELLRLNPGDNQGVRYQLASAYIEMGRDQELAGLLVKYKDEASACWTYSAALLAFRVEGDTPRARKLLGIALRSNAHVPDYLLGRSAIPSQVAESFTAGEPGEAVDYAAQFLAGWRQTPRALEWLRGFCRLDEPDFPPERAPKGPTPASKKRLLKIQAEATTWQIECRHLPMWVGSGEAAYRPWILLVIDVTYGLILGQEVTSLPPTPAHAWDKLSSIITKPQDGPPVRPAVIELGGQGAWTGLTPHLAEAGIESRPIQKETLIDEFFQQLVEHLNGRPPLPGLLEMPGVKSAHLARFYEAAADFYRAAPWQWIGGGETVKVQCSRYESGPWYGVVFGQMGMTLGVALYDDLGNLVRIRDGQGSDEENARATVALSLTYGNKTEIPVTDLEAIEAFGWKVADPEGYPSPVRKERGMMMRPPLLWEIQLLEAVLRVLPLFLTQHDRSETSPASYDVETGGGLLPLKISWVNDDREQARR